MVLVIIPFGCNNIWILFLAGLLTLALVPGLLGYLDSVFVRVIAALCIGVFAFFFDEILAGRRFVVAIIYPNRPILAFASLQ